MNRLIERLLLEAYSRALPEGAVLACPTCGHLWVQTAAEALAAPTAPVRCPQCGTVRCNPGGAADVPHVVGAPM